jgi:hypothetical protein
MTNIDQTTEKIKETLGVNFTIREVRKLIAETEGELSMQAPYLSARLLHRLERLKLALGEVA